jgi:hypothetical protein
VLCTVVAPWEFIKNNDVPVWLVTLNEPVIDTFEVLLILPSKELVHCEVGKPVKPLPFPVKVPKKDPVL